MSSGNRPVRSGDSADDSRRDLVLQSKELRYGQLAIERFCPQMRAAISVKQLRVHPDGVPSTPDAAFHYITRSQLASDFANIDRLSLEPKGGVTADDQ